MNKVNQLTRRGSALREFLRSEAAGGMILMVVAALALIAANLSFSDLYFAFTHLQIGPVLSEKLGPMTVHLWVNDGLMAIFFLFVGLEIKREFSDGHLASWADRRLPMAAALFGMIIPAVIYLSIVQGETGLAKGWAIPAATDIAFAIGVLALLGSRAPASLKLFLTTVAIIDDMGAVTVIALFYTSKLHFGWLLGSVPILAAMFVLNRLNITRLWPYILLGLLLWFAVLLSGVHATIAGVLMAFTIPYRRTLAAPDAEDSALHRLEHMLARPVAFFIVPLFGFVNAGVSLSGVTVSSLLAPLPFGIAAGLFIGKQLGIFASIWMMVKLKLASRPKDANWTQIYGVSLLCGIGFTMSLFIGGLAFKDPGLNDAVKIGVLMGSVLSAIAGYTLLRFASSRIGKAR